MISVCNCGNCKYRDDSCVLAIDPPRFICLNRDSGKQYVEMGDYCVMWEEEKPKWDTTTSDDVGNVDNTGYIIKQTQKALLKLTERVQKLENDNSVNCDKLREYVKRTLKLEDSVDKLQDNDKVEPLKDTLKETEFDVFKEHREDFAKTLDVYERLMKPKQEEWIVHRTLRKNGGRETYVSLDRNGYGLRNYDTPFNHYELYSHPDRKQAKEFSREEAIHIRDILNEKRIGKRYLWVISRVEN